MRMSSEPSREEIDRLRGLARAAWARLQRDDLDDEQSASAQDGSFLVRLSGFSYLGNRYAPENFEHMAEKISLRYVEIRGLFGFRCT